MLEPSVPLLQRGAAATVVVLTTIVSKMEQPNCAGFHSYALYCQSPCRRKRRRFIVPGEPKFVPLLLEKPCYALLGRSVSALFFPARHSPSWSVLWPESRCASDVSAVPCYRKSLSFARPLQKAIHTRQAALAVGTITAVGGPLTTRIIEPAFRMMIMKPSHQSVHYGIFIR